MPGPVINKPQSWDPAEVASKFPRPLQWAGGAALQGLKDLSGGDDPNQIMGAAMPLTTIGPKAIPLMDQENYLKQAASSTINDLASKFRSANPNLLESHPLQSETVKAALQNPRLEMKIKFATFAKNPIEYMKQTLSEQEHTNPGNLEKVIQALADAYHTELK